MMDLARRLDTPKPHDSDDRDFKPGAYQPVCRISTDAFAAYAEAVDLAFGPYVQYGQLTKDYRNADQPGRYAPPEMVNADRRLIFGDFDPFTICTSHVERNNLSIRTFVKRFTRLSLGFSKKLDNLCAAVALHMAYYNFCWRPKPLGGITPAMAAGVTNTLWNFDHLYDTILKR